MVIDAFSKTLYSSCERFVTQAFSTPVILIPEPFVVEMADGNLEVEYIPPPEDRAPIEFGHFLFKATRTGLITPPIYTHEWEYRHRILMAISDAVIDALGSSVQDEYAYIFIRELNGRLNRELNDHVARCIEALRNQAQHLPDLIDTVRRVLSLTRNYVAALSVDDEQREDRVTSMATTAEELMNYATLSVYHERPRDYYEYAVRLMDKSLRLMLNAESLLMDPRGVMKLHDVLAVDQVSVYSAPVVYLYSVHKEPRPLRTSLSNLYSSRVRIAMNNKMFVSSDTLSSILYSRADRIVEVVTALLDGEVEVYRGYQLWRDAQHPYDPNGQP